MTLWDTQVFKRLGTENWANRYLINASDISSVLENLSQLYEAERLFHATNVQFTYVRV